MLLDAGSGAGINLVLEFPTGKTILHGVPGETDNLPEFHHRQELRMPHRHLKARLPLLFILLFLGSLATGRADESRQHVILDADTGNEVDDLFAIVRLLLEPSIKVTALNATQWQASHWSIPDSMENSHRLNQVLLGHMGLSVKTRRGGVDRMFDWGDKAQHSAAAYEIIKQARAKAPGEKLTIVALGALTNVASAIYIDPSIEERIRLYWLGTRYDFDADILTRVDFNCVMDVQAVEILLGSKVEMHVMPSNVAAAMKFTYSETEGRLQGLHPVADFLCKRWQDHLDGGRQERVLWDLALVQAVLHPELATKVEITTSRDSGSREIFYYKSIDAETMRDTFFRTIEAYFGN